MKITIDARFYGTEHSGLGRYTMNFLDSLFTLKSPYSYNLLLKSKYHKTLKVPSNFNKIRFDVPHYSISEQLLLPYTLSSHSCDIYHALHLNVPLISICYQITTIHDLIKNHFKDKSTTTRGEILFRIKRLGYQRVIKNAVTGSDKLIVPSNFVKQDILNNYNIDESKIKVIYESVDPAFLKRDNSKTQNYILFVGNPYPHKNLRVLLEAFEAIEGYELVLVSKNNSFLQKELKILSASAREKITIIEEATDQKLRKLYRQAIVTVTPSLMEGFGLVGLESLAQNTPVIASEIPVYKEIYKDNVIYFDPKSKTDLITKLKNTLDKRPKANLPAKIPTWLDLAKEIHNIYDESSLSIRSNK